MSFRTLLFFGLAALAVLVLLLLPLRRERGTGNLPSERTTVYNDRPAATPTTLEPVELGATETPSSGGDEDAPDWAQLNRQISGVVSRVTPSVVYLTICAPGAPRCDEYPTETGSGILLSPEGYVLTNAHVIRAAGTVMTTLPDKREFAAEVVGSDPTTDLAVLRLLEPDDDLPVAALGDSDDLQVGESVLVVGSPFTLQSTVTFGIVSALGRQPRVVESEFRIEDFIQTDAAINPGNSGGAMVNLRGEVVGIVTAIASESGVNEGFGFAVPSNLARRTAEDLIKYGEPRRGYLGVSLEPMTATTARGQGMDRPRGVFVNNVVRNGPADRAGILQGDVLLRVGGRPVNELAQFQSRLALSRPGERVPVVVWRGGSERSLSATLLGRDDPVFNQWLAAGEPSAGAPAPLPAPGRSASPDWGVRFRDLTADERRSFGVSAGAYVEAIDPQSAADIDGLPLGAIVIRVEGRPVRNAAEARAALSRQGRLDAPALLRVRRSDGVTAFYDLASPYVE